MITYRKYEYLRGAQYPTVDGICKSADTKPTDVANGSIMYEMDTGSMFMFNEEDGEWEEVSGSGGGGGGGGGDFSTAKVTFLVTEVEARISMPRVEDSDSDSQYADSYIHVLDGTTNCKAILYRGMAYIKIDGSPYYEVSDLTGDIEDDGDGYYIVTGDCTVTIVPK